MIVWVQYVRRCTPVIVTSDSSRHFLDKSSLIRQDYIFLPDFMALSILWSSEFSLRSYLASEEQLNGTPRSEESILEFSSKFRHQAGDNWPGAGQELRLWVFVALELYTRRLTESVRNQPSGAWPSQRGTSYMTSDGLWDTRQGMSSGVIHGEQLTKSFHVRTGVRIPPVTL